MTSGDVERDAHRHYRPTDLHADQLRSRSRKRKRQKKPRRKSRSISSYSTERTRQRTKRSILSANALIRGGSFPDKAQQAYSESLITSYGDKVTVHISELQQLNLELMRGKLVAHTFNARFNSDDHDLDGSSRDLQTYGKISTNLLPLLIPGILHICHESFFSL